jgi:hypothetical protein
MARSTHFTTTTGAVTATLIPSASILYGLTATGAGNAATYYIKFFWEGTGTPPVATGTQSTVIPAAGTNHPHLTVQVPVAGVPLASIVEPLNNGGRIWYWVSTGLGDLDTTVLVTGGDVVSIVYD